MHDTTLDRTTNGTGNVADSTYAYISTLDAGSWFDPIFNRCKVPTFAAVLEYLPGKFERVHYEIKGNHTDAQIIELVDMVADAGLIESSVFISSSTTVLTKVRSANPLAGVGLIGATRTSLLTLYENVGGRSYCSFAISLIQSDPTIVRYARSLGIDVYGQTVINSKDAGILLTHGVTVIQSNYGIYAERRYSGGNILPVTSDYSNMIDVSVNGSSSVSNGKLIVDAQAGGRDGRIFGAYFNPLGTITFGFFGSLVSKAADGVIGIFGEEVFSNEIDITSDDVVYYQSPFTTNAVSTRSPTGIVHRSIHIGGGSAAVGVAEYFGFTITNQGRAVETPCVARGHLWIDNGVAKLRDELSSHSILSVLINPAQLNEIIITLDVAQNQTSVYAFIGEVTVRGTGYFDYYSRIANTTDNTVAVRIYNYTNPALVDLTTLDSMFFNFQVS